MDTYAPCTMEDLPFTAHALAAPVELVRDDVGVTHVYAQSDDDLFYAQGYVQMRDRAWQLEKARRAATGTLAEVFGEDELETDLIARAFDFRELGCRTAHAMAAERPEDYRLVEAFASGINRRVDEINRGAVEAPDGFLDGQAGIQPSAWTAEDVLAHGRRVTLGYANQLDFDILATMGRLLVSSFDEVPVYQSGSGAYIMGSAGGPPPPAVDGSAAIEGLGELEIDERKLDTLARAHGVSRASNNWAVNGRHTDNGMPLLANDPHTLYNNPSRVYTVHLDSKSAGGTFDVAGWSFPGLPAIQLGHNRDLAWAATTNFPDTMDTYDVVIEGGVAFVGGQEIAVRERQETVTVQVGAATEDRPYTFTEVPGYGIILPGEVLPIDKALLVRGELLVNWVAFHEVGTEGFEYIDFDRAATLDEFAAATRYDFTGMQNWVGATADGIRYQTHGKIPVRAGGRPNLVQDADDPAVHWTGDYVDPALLPALDGSQDFIVTANNDPIGATADNDPTNDAWYHGSYYDPGFRAALIERKLAALVDRGSITTADMIALQQDTESDVAGRLLPLLAADIEAIVADTELAAAWAELLSREADFAPMLHTWDRQLDGSSSAAVLYRAWAAFLSRQTLGSDFSVLFDAIDGESPVTVTKVNLLAHEWDLESLTEGRADEYRLDSLVDALAWIDAHPGQAWPDTHLAHFTSDWHPDVVFATPGDDATINVGNCDYWDDDKVLADTCPALEGPIFRQVTRFGADRVPETLFNLGVGETGSLDDWSTGVYRDLWFRRADVDAHAVEVTELPP
jgi:penicillin amidase